MLITYILFLTKLQKRQTLEKGFALFKNDITGSEPAFGIANILQKAQGDNKKRQSQMTLPSLLFDVVWVSIG
jgi:hypothetical protein